jgi:hypothetical protein
VRCFCYSPASLYTIFDATDSRVSVHAVIDLPQCFSINCPRAEVPRNLRRPEHKRSVCPSVCLSSACALTATAVMCMTDTICC